jgi:hypothetical protein
MLARLFGPENSQSLLDALCISTVPKPLALSCLQSSEESSGSVHVKKSRYYGGTMACGRLFPLTAHYDVTGQMQRLQD